MTHSLSCINKKLVMIMKIEFEVWSRKDHTPKRTQLHTERSHIIDVNNKKYKLSEVNPQILEMQQYCVSYHFKTISLYQYNVKPYDQ